MLRDWLIKMRGPKTQEAVSIDAGISRALYTQIERGTRNPSVTTAKKIANAMGFDWTLFFDEKCNEMAHKAAM